MPPRRRATLRPPAASPPYQKRRVPFLHIPLSLLFGSPIPRRWVFLVLALVREQWRIGRLRLPDKLSYLEGLVVSHGITTAARIRDEGAAKLAGLIDQATSLVVELASLRAEDDRLDEQPIHGVNGELLSAAEATDRLELLLATVAKETDAGSLKHRRVWRALVRLVPFATVLDLPILLWFVGSVFNVDWTNLQAGQSIIPFVTSAVFAILGTIAVALGLNYFGRDLKGYKDDHGHLALPPGRAKTMPLVFLSFSIAVALAAGVVMAYRVMSDSMTSGNGWLGAAILGSFFALIVCMLNVVVWAVHYRDGSPVTDELDHLREQLTDILLRHLRIEQHIDQVTAKLGTLRVQGDTEYDTTKARLDRPIKGAHQLVLLARSYHQGCNWSTELLTPAGDAVGLIAPLVTLDTSVLDRLIERLRSNAPAVNDGEADEPTTETPDAAA